MSTDNLTINKLQQKIIWQEKVIRQMCKVLDAVTSNSGPFGLQGPKQINGKDATWLEWITQEIDQLPK